MRKAQGLVGGLIGVFIFAIIATALIPVIADQVNIATGNSNTSLTNLSTTDITLLELWPTFIVIGGLIAIIAAVGLS
jgi:hypothetical protein